MSKWIWMVIAGALLTVAGAVATAVYFVQPWRTCFGGDDAPDTCPMLPLDFHIQSLAMLATLVGIIMVMVMVGSILFYRASRRSRTATRPAAYV